VLDASCKRTVADLASAHERERTAPAQILGASRGVVLTDPAINIRGDAGVQRARIGCSKRRGSIDSTRWGMVMTSQPCS
jgi:hypothetical protein